MKLKCDAHKRRVFIFTDGKMVHRSDIGDGNKIACGSPTASIGGETFGFHGIFTPGIIRPPRSVRA